MTSSPAKRRKTDHSDGAVLSDAISAAVRQPTTFVLETAELLAESRFDYERSLEGVDELLRRLKTSIEAIETHEAIPINDAAKKLKKAHGVIVPFPEPGPPKDSNYKLAFSKPAAFNVVGSYVSRTMVKVQEDHAVDMIVVIPKEVLQEKDYLNLRYFYKRAYYAAKFAAALQIEFDGVADLTFESLNDNPLLPTVSLKPRKGDYRIRVIPCAPDGYFPKQKLGATAGLIRSGADDDKKAHAPTPFYNSTLKADGSYVPYLRVLKQAEKSCPAFKDACMLGRIWLRQRGFGGAMSRGGFGHFEWSVLMALLLQTGGRKETAALSPSLNPSQLFKATIQYLAATDFLKKPFILGSKEEGLEAIRESGPVIYDAPRQLNLAYKMSSSSGFLLQQFAKWTHALLNDKSVDQFAPTFITKVNQPALMFDLNASLDMPEDYAEATGSREKLWTFGNKVHNVLKRALGDRAKLVSVHTAGLPMWSPRDSQRLASDSTVSIGILFDPSNMSRTVDHGPPAEEKKEAEKFRRFWGEKSELRRFKDGSILETLIWTGSTPAELCEEIVRYILQLHLKIPTYSESLTFYTRGFASLVGKPTDAAAFAGARAAFETFEKDIRGLEDLPLHVRQLAPIAPELRNATIEPPAPGSPKHAPKPMDVVIFFEASGKWPDNLAAIQRAKIAFLLRIGTLLSEAKTNITTHLGLEDAQLETQNLAYLDVVYSNGVAFRLRIHSDLEEVLLDRRTKDKTLDQHLRTESATLLANFRRLYNHLPLHNQMIRTYTTRFPALSPTIRLLKRWFDSHKLSSHFPTDLIELLALHIFLAPHPWPQPSSPAVGFLRVLLFLAQWDWRSEPLVIDTSSYSNDASDETLSKVDASSAATRLEAWRNLDPAMNRVVLLVCTPGDPSGTSHTTLDGHPSPSKVVAARMTALARSATRVVREKGTAIGLPDAGRQLLFVPALSDFDILLHLNKKALKATSRVYEHDDPNDVEPHHSSGKFKNLDTRTGEMPLPLATHPARLLLNQLATTYAGPLVFFQGSEDDATIGAIWNPLVSRRSFRVNLLGNYKPVALAEGRKRKVESESESSGEEEDDLVEVDREAILAEVARIGGELVERIVVKGQ
ncbi:hypothetical protein DL546_006072 [Coniochaeta pulveracea]|uniref:U3 small nucleolar RNA-associated protein 22 n=1 Tax=Coniochaeta pulveracea TaxID=177199 RepID=A0A420Y9H7_9PEZI|nr:hypothetical protein DL546_006072 [Coniochaeta pulveracea]